MTLDEQISQITNPQEFARLCNAIFVDIHGYGYQVIDGSRSDNGNDGYVDSEARMLAIHCPVKPEQRTDAGYLKKIRSDLGKAAKLKLEGKYKIDRWTFVTPRKLADDVISTMRAEAGELGIEALHVEAAFLANELSKRPHVLKGFPALQQLDIFAQLEEIKLAVKAKAAQAATKPTSVAPVVVDSRAEDRVREIRDGVPTAEVKRELRVIAHGTRDPVVEINAILVLLRWFEPADDDHGELVSFAERGVRLAEQLEMPDIGACCLAHKAQIRAMAFNLQMIESFFSAQVEQRLGVSVEIDTKQRQLKMLQEMDEAWRGDAKAAFELLKQSTSVSGNAATVEIMGSTLGQLAHTHRAIGDASGADKFLGECKAMLMAAKDMHRSAGDELGASNAVFNLANQIRFHGKEAEALELVKGVIPVAAKFQDRVLFQKAQWLKEAISSGKVPAYEQGERRVWAHQEFPKK